MSSNVQTLNSLHLSWSWLLTDTDTKFHRFWWQLRPTLVWPLLVASSGIAGPSVVLMVTKPRQEQDLQTNPCSGGWLVLVLWLCWSVKAWSQCLSGLGLHTPGCSPVLYTSTLFIYQVLINSALNSRLGLWSWSHLYTAHSIHYHNFKLNSLKLPIAWKYHRCRILHFWIFLKVFS